MNAVVYKGEHEVAVEEVDEPEIEHPNDVTIDTTTTCICGSDLHMYEGRTAAEPGIVFGHENMGIVTEVGEAVSTLEEGDPVEQIKSEHGSGVDKGVDAVGYQALDPETDPGDDAYNPARENPAVVINQLIQVVRPTGELGIPGLYVPSDPGAPDEITA